MKYLSILIIFFLSAGCGEKQDDHSGHNHDHSSDSHVHVHKAPYGGVLTELKGHKASLECLVEKDGITLYVHDGCAEKNIRISQEKIEVLAKSSDGTEKELSFGAVESELSGDKVGNASSFQNRQDGVKFEAVEALTVKSIEIQGILYKDVEIKVKK